MVWSDEWRSLAEALLGTVELTPDEVARAAGVELDAARRLWQALGFPPVADDERLFSRADADILRIARMLIEDERADPAVLVQLARVTGQSLARVADAQVTASAERLKGLHTPGQPGVAPASLAHRIETLAPHLERLLGYVWRRHLLAACLRHSAAPEAGRVQVVGFVDMVGFTSMSQALEAHELARMVDRFEATAYQHIPEHGGRVVKTIGDEVMFAADDAGGGAEIALGLLDAHARDPELPDARAGLARGPVLAWEGDLFGPTVNLASRLVNLARPGSVLVADDLGKELRGDPALALHHLRSVRLQGIGRVRPWVLRRTR